MSKIDRREFLKLVGAGSVGAGVAVAVRESAKKRPEQYIPFVEPHPDHIPGIASWFNTVCKQCGAGCGIQVRILEGRAKKIEGNPAHPVSQGRLCALGQAGLNVLYNPDRLSHPTIAGAPASWDDALDKAASYLSEASSAGKKIYILTDALGPSLSTLVQSVATALGSRNLIQFEFAHPENIYEANRLSFGEVVAPYYDIANAELVVSFGADFLGAGMSPVHDGVGFGKLRAGKRGHLVQIEPRMSLTGANADTWLPAKPGSEGALALGIANLMIQRGIYRGRDRGDWERVTRQFTPGFVAVATGLTEVQIEHLADEFAKAQPALAIGGGSAAHSSNGVANMIAINALNVIAGNLGKKGGLLFNDASPFGVQTRQGLTSYAGMLQLKDDIDKGAVGALIVHNANPAFGLPAASGVAEVLGQFDRIISIGSFTNETTANASVVLPSDTYLESWGDDAPEPGVGLPIASLVQPVVTRVFDTRAAGDIFLDLAKRGGNGAGLAADMKTQLQSNWRALYDSRAAALRLGSFDAFWTAVLEAGVWGESATRKQAPRAQFVVSSVRYEAPAYAGDESSYPFVLQPFMTQALHDGRGANLPWIQELPDPLTSVVYGTWVELNPVTAGELGVTEGDLLRVESGHGALEAPALIYPGIRPDVVGVPIGQGHDRYGRYASRGANPIHILAPATDERTGALAWSATRVNVTKTGKRARIIKTSGRSRHLGREILGGSHNGHG